MMNSRLIEALEKCIKLMEEGDPLEDCLIKFPEFAPQIREILNTADNLKSLWIENIPAESMDQNRIKVISQAMRLSSEKVRRRNNATFGWLIKPVKQVSQSLIFLYPVAGRLILSIAIAFLCILFSGGMLITSAKSLPGDSLYPVKRVVEDIRIYFAPSGEIRHEYEDSYSQQRVDEVSKLLGLARVQQISYEGIITSMSDTRWIVSGIPVAILPDTIIVPGTAWINAMEPGMRVEIEGKTSMDGWVIADEIHLREYQYIGIVEDINARYWQISGTTLLVTSKTQVDAGLQVGDEVTILIRSEDRGLLALAILREMHTIITPISSQLPSITPTQNKYSTSENTVEFSISGTLEEIRVNYWIVSGEVIFLVSDTRIDDQLKIGDNISVRYVIEVNGSFTAREIARIENSDSLEENDIQETPNATGDDEDQDASMIDPTEADEPDDDDKSEDPDETPEPLEDDLDR